MNPTPSQIYVCMYVNIVLLLLIIRSLGAEITFSRLDVTVARLQTFISFVHSSCINLRDEGLDTEAEMLHFPNSGISWLESVNSSVSVIPA